MNTARLTEGTKISVLQLCNDTHVLRELVFAGLHDEAAQVTLILQEHTNLFAGYLGQLLEHAPYHPAIGECAEDCPACQLDFAFSRE